MINFDHHSGKHMEIDGARIYVETIGNSSNPVLLVLHGGFGNIEDFNSLISGIEKEFRFIGIDCRGQGKSTLGTKALTYEQIQKRGTGGKAVIVALQPMIGKNEFSQLCSLSMQIDTKPRLRFERRNSTRASARFRHGGGRGSPARDSPLLYDSASKWVMIRS